jgi:hypothetical protein
VDLDQGDSVERREAARYMPGHVVLLQLRDGHSSLPGRRLVGNEKPTLN